VPDASHAAGLVESDAELIAGRHPVEEAFTARRAARRLLVVPQRRAALEALVLHATTLRLPVVEVEGGTLTSIAGFDGHQGVALVTEARTWATVDDVLALARQRSEPPFVLVLDSLEDPQNMGTLLRAAEAAGVHGVLFPTRRAAPLTPAAVKASAGAVEHLLLVPADDLPGAIADLHSGGLRVVGAEAEAALTHREADLRGPLALVVGSEGHGLGAPIRRRLDLSVRIPMRGRVGSLNAAVAGSILLFEAAGQRDLPAREPRTGDAEVPEGVPETEETAVTPADVAAEPTVDAASGPETSVADEPNEASAALTGSEGQPGDEEEMVLPATPRRARKPRTSTRSSATEIAAERSEEPEPDTEAEPAAPARRARRAATPSASPEAKPAKSPRGTRARKAAEPVEPAEPAATDATGDDLLPGEPVSEGPS
jgi:23S rRNA (guanosine2251-2'-O)-methyltransferase